MEKNLGKQLKANGGDSADVNAGWGNSIGGKKVKKIIVDCV